MRRDLAGLKIIFAIAAAMVVPAAGAAKSTSSLVPLPQGRDIRSILTASSLLPSDIEALRPGPNGIRYYYGRFDSTLQEQNVSFIKVEMYLITLLPLDYLSMDRFTTRLLGPGGEPKTIDGVMASLPNLMEYLKGISTGDIKRRVEQVGQFQRVTMEYTLDEKALAKRYPQMKGMFTTQHIQSFSIDLRNSDADLLLRFEFAKGSAVIRFLLDPNGYFVATGPQGDPLPHPGKRLGLEEARRGARLYLDLSFDARATLLELFKLFRVEIKRLRMQIDLRENPGGFFIAWQAIDVVPGAISITGLNPDPIRESILHLKDTFKGTINFQPIKIPSGESLTFMRVWATGERMDNWLVNLALLTWEKIGQQLMSELSLPISDVLLAAHRDIMLQAGGENP